jgi:hypothetical protein
MQQEFEDLRILKNHAIKVKKSALDRLLGNKVSKAHHEMKA